MFCWLLRSTINGMDIMAVVVEIAPSSCKAKGDILFNNGMLKNFLHNTCNYMQWIENMMGFSEYHMGLAVFKM